MEGIVNSLKQIPPMYLGIIGGFILLSIVINILALKNLKKGEKEFLKTCPNPAKLKLKKGISGIYYTQIDLASVNGEKPVIVTKGMNVYYLVKPGKIVTELSFFKERPGLMYKSVSKATEFEKVEFEVEADKEYLITYNEETGYNIEEVKGK